MNEYDDRALWLAYQTCQDDDSRKRIAGEIVGMHAGFIRQYAHKTAFPYWTPEVREDYVQELFAVALGKVSAYDRHHRGHDGRNATFPTFVRRYFMDVRWRIAGREEAFSVGKETRRMIADVQALQWRHAAAGLDEPTLDELADWVSQRHGKTVTPRRIKRLLERPFVESSDNADSVTGAPLHASFEDRGPGPETLTVEAVVAAELQATVADIVASLAPLERAIVFGRLMEQTATLAELAARFGVSQGVVRETERLLVERLRGSLQDFA